MNEELNFEAYLNISPDRFNIYLLDKIKLKNIYYKEIQIVNNNNKVDYNLLTSFLDQNIFKIEKLIGKFLKNIIIIIENNRILNLTLGIKKKNYEEKINKKHLENAITELKDLFRENYKNNRLLHVLVNRYSIDEIDQLSFEKELDGTHLCIELNFISIPNILVEDINRIMKKYEIKVDQFIDAVYMKNFFNDNSIELSVMASKIRDGQNEKEIILIPKSLEKKGFFEKFFQLFN